MSLLSSLTPRNDGNFDSEKHVAWIKPRFYKYMSKLAAYLQGEHAKLAVTRNQMCEAQVRLSGAPRASFLP